MKSLKHQFLCLSIAVLPGATSGANEVRTLNTPRTFPPISSRAEWQARAKEIREQALVSCGLWPMPAKSPLNAQVFGRIEREGYSIEKVALQTWPGVYLGGNLYRPLGRGRGPFPGVLNPHGHWKDGRLTDVPDGSVPARCINFAKQGMVAFSFDMVGYNDTWFANYPGGPLSGDSYKRHRLFATNATCQLWNISLMGLQTWNSIRALDFLESLPDVDKQRLGCTGASGGGTQTFMLGAIDDRLAVQAPCVMVSHSMQGGCSCENAPGLRIAFSNMEFAAAAAPRPQLLVAATGDWTRDTPTVEGPALEAVYRLFNAPEKLRYVQFDFGHNYNRTSREAVYAWFGRWLRNQPDAMSLAEADYQKEADASLRVFPDGKLPPDAITDTQFIESFIAMRRAQIAALQPRRKADFEQFRQVLLPLWRHTLQIERTPADVRVSFGPLRAAEGFQATTFRIQRAGEDAVLSGIRFTPPKLPEIADKSPLMVVLANSEGSASACDTDQNPQGLAKQLLGRGCGVVVITEFSDTPAADPFANFYTTYNRTRLQNRVRDLVTVCGSIGKLSVAKAPPPRVVLCGEGYAGLWALLAAPAADAVVADCAGFNAGEDAALLDPDVFCPGLLCLGGFETAALLAAPHPLVLHNVGKQFATDRIVKGYRVHGSRERLRIETDLLNWGAIAKRVTLFVTSSP